MNDRTKGSGGGTLLSHLGFADKDGNASRHDLAIAYAEARTVALAKMICPDRTLVSTRLFSEVKIVKTAHGYSAAYAASSFVVGFADGVLCLNSIGSQSDIYPNKANALVEVKITRCSAGDVIRQINAYRGHVAVLLDDEGQFSTELQYDAPGLLLLDYDISGAESRLLRSNKIFPIRLGADFEEFIRTTLRTALLPTLGGPT